MATTAWLVPTTVVEDTSRGFTGWNNLPGSITDGSNNTYATYGIYSFSQAIRTGSVRLVKAGVISGDDKASANTTQLTKFVDTGLGFGGAADLWGLTLSQAEVNAANFGVVWADDQNSCYLKATGFNASIPAGAIIKGIEVEVEARQVDNGFSYSSTSVDAIRIRITYGTDHTISGGGRASGMLMYEQAAPDKLNKEYQYKISNKGAFLGEWSDEVSSEPKFKIQINTLGTTMPIKLGRTLDSIENVPEQLYDQSGDDFLTQDGDTLVGYAGTSNAVGADSDADVNYDVEVNAYYGGYDYLITQQGEPLVTQDYELLQVVDGAPEGRSLITGFITKWKGGYNGDEAIDTTLTTYGWELNQIILETASTVAINIATDNTQTYFGRDGTGTRDKLRQTLTAPSTGLLAKVVFKGIEQPFWIGSYKGGPAVITLTLQIFAGTAHTGTPLATVSKTITSNTDDEGSSYEPFAFELADYITLTNAQVYSLVLSGGQLNTSGDLDTYILKGTYSGGQLNPIDSSGTVGATDTGDLAFELHYAGGLTTVPFLSVDPSTIMKAIVDRAAAAGAHISYTADSIQMTGTTVSYTFKTNTMAEAINKVLELAPADWYYYIDPADNVLYFKPRPTTPDHTFTLGRDIGFFEIERDMEELKNVAYFSGGGEPALFLKTVDQTSLDAWRRGLAKLSDNRVTDTGSATTISEGHLERNNAPQYRVTMTVSAADYDIETIKPGQVAAYGGFGNFVDELQLQISELSYELDTVRLVLGTLKPPVSKRLEDLKRNLDVLEQQNNPSSPA